MNAPEKIYRTTTYLDSDRGKTVWKNKPVPGAENIEYTRTDAFIEKVINFIEMLGHGFTITDKITHTNYDEKQLINDFVDYIKG